MRVHGMRIFPLVHLSVSPCTYRFIWMPWDPSLFGAECVSQTDCLADSKGAFPWSTYKYQGPLLESLIQVLSRSGSV